MICSQAKSPNSMAVSNFLFAHNSSFFVHTSPKKYTAKNDQSICKERSIRPWQHKVGTKLLKGNQSSCEKIFNKQVLIAK